MFGNPPVVRTVSGFCSVIGFMNNFPAALMLLLKSSSPSLALRLLSVGQEARLLGQFGALLIVTLGPQNLPHLRCG